MQNNDDVIEKISRNSKALWGVFGVLSMLGIFVFRVSSYIYDTKDLPPRVKQVEKDVEKLKSLPDKFDSLETRTSALELQLATNVAEIKTLLFEVRNNQNALNAQILKNGLEHNK